MPRRTLVLDAPSNLGLRPPAPGTVPGCHKLAGALRDHGFVSRIGAADAGCVTPPRYDITGWKPHDGVFNAPAMAGYTRRLAGRVSEILDADGFPVLLGGDCSILLGSTLALRRRGRYGLAFLDGHSDFRHVGNAPYVGAAAGEDLALVTGRGQPDLADLDGLGPYVRDTDVAVLGIRSDDDLTGELTALGIPVWDVARLRADGPGAAARAALDRLEGPDLDGFWVHLDVDILNPELMPAVDSPDPGGLDYAELVGVLEALVTSPACVGAQVTVFDPDLDPDGRLAAELTDALVEAFAR
ncbi:arginase family protein [Longispora urticae]